MRCDLHVHSARSGPVDVRLFAPYANESYAEPGEVYQRARAAGMDLVTLTDHDTIAGALELRRWPDTFVSEEVTCMVPGGRELHLGVYDISEGQHEQIARRRRDAEALFAYLAEESIPACLNHPFSALTGRRETDDLCRALAALPLVEARNGMMSPAVNARAEAARRRAKRPGVGGSDAHTLRTVARAFTVVPGARTRQEFLDGLRRGLTVPAGESGGYARLTGDIARIAAGAFQDGLRAAVREGRWGRLAVFLFAPAMPLAPGDRQRVPARAALRPPPRPSPARRHRASPLGPFFRAFWPRSGRGTREVSHERAPHLRHGVRLPAVGTCLRLVPAALVPPVDGRRHPPR